MKKLFLAAMLMFCSPALAQTTPYSPAEIHDRAFDNFRVTLARTTEDCKGIPVCRPILTVEGTIYRDSPLAFLKVIKLAGTLANGSVVAVNSRGGDTIGGMELGRIFRENGFDTIVGTVPGKGKTAMLVTAGAICESMCPIMMLGGVRAFAPLNSVIAVHQIWPGDKRTNPQLTPYTADDVSVVQEQLAEIAMYLVEMGANVHLLKYAMKSPPWEKLTVIPAGKLAELGFVEVKN
jgi:hypothetical protein